MGLALGTDPQYLAEVQGPAGAHWVHCAPSAPAGRPPVIASSRRAESRLVTGVSPRGACIDSQPRIVRGVCAENLNRPVTLRLQLEWILDLCFLRSGA